MHDLQADRGFENVMTSADDELRIYAILDAARDKTMLGALGASGLPSACLFEGPVCKVLLSAAPHVVQLSATAPFCRWLFDEGWGKSWGIFAWCSEDLPVVRLHFRSLLRAIDERGRDLYFRYYDPRVLRQYLPTCGREELDRLFGPTQALLLEGAGGEVLTYHRRGIATCS